MKRPLHRRLALALIPLLLLAFLSPLALLPGKAQAEPLVCVYFPNWNVYSSNYGQVKDLPWDTLDCIYHAFWKVAPEGDGFAVV